MGGGGHSISSQQTQTTTTTNANTTTTVGDIGLTGQNAINLAAVMGNTMQNTNANLLAATNSSYNDLIQAGSQNYSDLLMATVQENQDNQATVRDALQMATNVAQSSLGQPAQNKVDNTPAEQSPVVNEALVWGAIGAILFFWIL